MNTPKRTRWLSPILVLVLTTAPAVAVDRKITLQGTIEDADKPGKRLNDVTVKVTVGSVVKGSSESKDVQNQGKKESGVYKFDLVIDDANPVINLVFEDRTNQEYLDAKISLLVGESPLSIPKALVKKTSRRVSADDLRTHAELLNERVVEARRRRMPEANLRKTFGPKLSELIHLSSTERFVFDVGLQAELGRLVRTWDVRPSAALSSQDNHVLTYRAGSVIVSVGPDRESTKFESWKVFYPSGKWDMTHRDEIISSAAGGGVVLFNADREPLKPYLTRPEETVAGPQSVVAAANDGRRFASAGPGGTVTLYSREGPRESLKRERSLYAGPGAVRALAFAPNGRALAAATLQGAIVSWRADNGDEILRLGLKDGDDPRKNAIPTTLTFAPDGPFLAVGTGLARDGKVVLIDVNKRSVVNIIASEQGDDRGGVTNVTYAMKGEFLLVEYDHRRGAILESRSGEVRKRLSGTLVPSPDGEWLGILKEENFKDPKKRPEIKPIRDFVKP